MTIEEKPQSALDAENGVSREAGSVDEVPYSIYTPKEKWMIVAMVALAGFYSPLPANIYFPAIPTLAKAFGKSIDTINQTVTVYLVFQGVSPMLWGPISDRYGRRLVYLGCLSILVASSIGLALCPTDKFWLLLFLRCFQSGGSASTIALGAGVIGDISTSKERGGYFGMFNLGPMLAPVIAPAMGGALSQSLGWRSIFWSIVIMVAVCLVCIALFLPETLRSIAGNGSLPVSPHSRALVPIVGRKAAREEYTPDPSRAKAKQSVNPFVLFTYPDVIVLLTFTGIVYAVNYTITATISSAFAKIYPQLSQTVLGLCYLPTGAGMIIGSTMTGKMLDWEYARIKSQLGSKFTIEYARLRIMPFYLALFIICVISWGWAIEAKAHIAVPLILGVMLGWTSIGILNTTMTLNVDILQSRSSGATACTNLVRCSLAAILISVIDRMTGAWGHGWTYAFWGAVCVLLLPLMLLEIRRGPVWRARREAAE
ncbi:MFS general substrate transporter [Dothidotthia symphoricarpi CBS 119687]|uniref:MFS general substrate transporter n=1 Tax=Dothidotthia symphoricarpi CBS 119687 TaxID=1392245 RepID=A0A6A6ADF9_9PLEO|nr:MFS general substrate transporter [Dothidotthia symphoricarpi CBS 119687]KAF2128994.1 MFS general substrate transporter [Dothidotthia symphoricarpi CBS 119687]